MPERTERPPAIAGDVEATGRRGSAQRRMRSRIVSIALAAVVGGLAGLVLYLVLAAM
jgi:hypothetical protein